MTDPIRHTVPADAAPDRLDRYLLALLPDLSRVQAKRLIDGGHALVGGKAVKAAHRIRPGETIEVSIPPSEASDTRPESIPLSVLHEDEYLLVIDKPAGMVVHPAPGNWSGTLVNALLGRGGKLSGVAGDFKPGIVHRLDKDTSGLMVIAKDDKTHRALAKQFAGRTVRRVYLAVVRGSVDRDQGTVDAPIGRHPVYRKKMAVDAGARRDAVTGYRVLKRSPRASLVELTPQTGRTHQLRVHMAHIGHPILGDARYGIHGGFERQALHAHKLGFEHPATGKWVEFTSPPPPDLKVPAC